MREYDFEERLSFSLSSNIMSYEDILSRVIPGVVSVTKTDVKTDKTGIDYIVRLRRGSEVGIDLKVRGQGCSKYWASGEPEIALETWSVKPDARNRGVVGWTLDESKRTDYTLHVFHPDDCDTCYLLPFQLLRKAFRIRKAEWESRYGVADQSSGRWKSQCVFVPARIVLAEIKSAMFVDQGAA